MAQARLYGNVTKCPRCGGKLRQVEWTDSADCQGVCGTRWAGVALAAGMNPFDLDESDERGEYIAHMLHEILATARRLVGAERDFVESVGRQFDDRGSLTDKQFSWLQDIYSRKTA